MEEIQKKISDNHANQTIRIILKEEAKHSDKTLNDFMKIFPRVELLDATFSLDNVFKQNNVHRWYSQENDEV